MPTVEIRERKSGTKYVVRVRNPDPAIGKVGYTSITTEVRLEADRFVKDCDERGVAWALAEWRRSQGKSDTITLDQWAEKHFAALTEPSGATVRRYRSVYKASWSPTLGNLPLDQITRSHVATALNAVEGTDKTRKNKWAVLTHMFKTAYQEGLIVKSPAVGIKLGRRSDHEREEHRYLTHAEFATLLAATPAHWRPLVFTLAGTGIRWGEAAALTVGDYDPNAATLRITKAEKQDPNHPGKFIVGPTKSRRSRRTVTLPSQIVAVLDQLTEGRAPSERMFLPPGGGPLRHRTFYMDIWLEKCAPAVPAPRPRLHDLRHSHVAWLLAENVRGGLATIQARLGHEKITTTVDTYGHLMPDVQLAAADAAERVFAAMPEITMATDGPKELD